MKRRATSHQFQRPLRRARARPVLRVRSLSPRRVSEVVSATRRRHLECATMTQNDDIYRTASSYQHTDLSPVDQLTRLGLGVMTTQMLSAVAELDIADKLAAGPRAAEDLAAETRTRT